MEIQPDIDQAIADFEELKDLSARFGFDLLGALKSLAEGLAPVWCCDIDDSAANATGHIIARYKLTDGLQRALATLRARDSLTSGQLPPHCADRPHPPARRGRRICPRV